MPWLFWGLLASEELVQIMLLICGADVCSSLKRELVEIMLLILCVLLVSKT